MNKIFTRWFTACFLILTVSISHAQEMGTLRFTFQHIANNQPIVLNDSSYVTPNGESYTIKKLRYYFSNFNLTGNPVLEDVHNYQLIDLAKKTSFDIPVVAGSYEQIGFLLGVDSIRNCSGAQDGALDPMNDMFWTWNTGYVVFKLDGSSPASSADRNRIEHHIGGFRFGQNVSTPLMFSWEKDNPLKIVSGKITEITIVLNLDQYWQSKESIWIAKEPVCTLPDALAKKIASNFPYLFKLVQTKIHEN